MSCIIKGCVSHSGKKENDSVCVTFHRFPQNENCKNEWIRRVARQDWKWSQHSRICSKHFTFNSFMPNTNVKWRRLRHNALPTLHLPITNSKKLPSNRKLVAKYDDAVPSTSSAYKNENEVESTYYGQCRCCLEFGHLKLMWFQYKNAEKSEVYGKMLVDCFCIQWAQAGNSLEHDQICEDCIDQIKSATEFKRRVLEAQEKLKKEAESDIPCYNDDAKDTSKNNDSNADDDDFSQDGGDSIHDDYNATEDNDIETLMTPSVIDRNKIHNLTEIEKDPLSLETIDEIKLEPCTDEVINGNEEIDKVELPLEPFNNIESDVKPIVTKSKDVAFNITKVHNKNLLEISVLQTSEDRWQSLVNLPDNFNEPVDINKPQTDNTFRPIKSPINDSESNNNNNSEDDDDTFESAQILGVSKGRIISDIPIKKAQYLPKSTKTYKPVKEPVVSFFEEALEKATEKAKRIGKNVLFTSQIDNSTTETDIPEDISLVLEKPLLMGQTFGNALQNALQKAKKYDKCILTPEQINRYSGNKGDQSSNKSIHNDQLYTPENNTILASLLKTPVGDFNNVDLPQEIKDKNDNKPQDGKRKQSVTFQDEFNRNVISIKHVDTEIADENDSFEVEYLEDEINDSEQVEAPGNNQDDVGCTGNEQDDFIGTGKEQDVFIDTGNEKDDFMGTGNEQDETMGSGNEQEDVECEELNTEYLIVEDDEDEKEVEKEVPRKRRRINTNTDFKVPTLLSKDDILRPPNMKDTIQRCVDFVKSSGLSVHKASSIFRVPRGVVQRHLDYQDKIQGQPKSVSNQGVFSKSMVHHKRKS